MIRDLRPKRQSVDAREVRADETEVEGGDREAGDRAPDDSPSSRPLEDERPAERQGEMHGSCGSNEG